MVGEKGAQSLPWKFRGHSSKRELGDPHLKPVPYLGQICAETVGEIGASVFKERTLGGGRTGGRGVGTEKASVFGLHFYTFSCFGLPDAPSQ